MPTRSFLVFSEKFFRSVIKTPLASWPLCVVHVAVMPAAAAAPATNRPLLALKWVCYSILFLGAVSAQSSTPTSSLSPTASPTASPGLCTVGALAGRDSIAGFADGTGTGALLGRPYGILASPTGSLVYVADASSGRVRAVRVSDGLTTTVAGQASAGGSDGILGASETCWPAAFAWHPDGVSLYLADSAGPSIRVLNTTSPFQLTTIAGKFSIFGSADGLGSSASFSSPWALAVHPVSGTLFVADRNNHRIRVVAPQAVPPALPALVSSPLGLSAAFLDGVGTNARFNLPSGLAISPSGATLYVSDQGNFRIRSIDLSTLFVSTLAGSGVSAFVEGVGAGASFGGPHHLARDNSIAPGGLLVADAGTNRLRGVSTLTGAVYTVAGSGEASGANGAALTSGFRGPQGISASPGGAVFISDTLSNTVRVLTCPSLSGTPTPSGTPSAGASPSGTPSPSSPPTRTRTSSGTPTGTPSPTPTPSAPCTVSTLAGVCGTVAFVDGPAATARLGTLSGLACCDASGNLYVADAFNVRLRSITPSGTVATVAGSGTLGTANGLGASALFGNAFGGLAIAPNGTLLFADMGNQRIRRIEVPTTLVSTLSGSSSTVVVFGYADGPGPSALWNDPEGLALDALNWVLYVAERTGNRIRSVRLPGGATSTLAGSRASPAGVAGYADTFFGYGDSAVGFTGMGVLFNQPRGLAWAANPADPSAGPLLVVADTLNARLRLVSTLNGSTGTLAGMAPGAPLDGIGGLAVVAAPLGIALYAPNRAAALNASSSGPGPLTPNPATSSAPVLVFTDTNRLRAVDLTSARVFTLAGTGAASSVNGAPASATFNSPLGVACDASRGACYTADSPAYCVRRYGCPPYLPATPTPTPTLSPTSSGSPTVGSSLTTTPSPTLTPSATGATQPPTPSTSPSPTPSAFGCFVQLLAGTGVAGNASGPAQGVGGAQFNLPVDVAVFNNTLYAVTETQHIVQRVNLAGPPVVTTFIGQSGVSGSVTNQPPPYVTLGAPGGIEITPFTNGTLFTSTAAGGYKVRATRAVSGFTTDYACSGTPYWIDGPALTGGCFYPADTATAADGTQFHVDYNLNRIRRVTPAPGPIIMSTYAGSGAAGFMDGIGTGASFSSPRGIAVHPFSKWVYVADTSNSRIRAINPSSVAVTTLAGSGAVAPMTDGLGAVATFNQPRGINFAPPFYTTLYVADRGNNAIRAIVVASALTTTLVGGTGAGNVNGPAALAKLNYPSGIAFSETTGLGYIADTNNHQIKVLVCAAPSATSTPTPSLSPGATPSRTPSASPSPTQSGTPSATPSATPVACVVHNAAGMPGWSGYINGACPNSCFFNSPGAVAGDPGGTFLGYIADGNSIRRFTYGTPGANNGFISTFLGGSGAGGYADLPGTAALFGALGGFAFTPDWPAPTAQLYIVDSPSRIRNATPSGLVSTLSGRGLAGFLDGPPRAAAFNFVASSGSNSFSGIALSPAWWPGRVLVCDTANHRIRSVSTASGWASTLAGNGTPGNVDGTCAGAQFSSPRGIAINPWTGVIYIADSGNHRLKAISVGTCRVITLAGSSAGFMDASGLSAQFNNPGLLVFDANVTSSLLIADTNNHRVRSYAPDTGIISTFAGNGATSQQLGSTLVAMLPNVRGVGIGPSGIAITSDSNNVARQIVCAPGVFLSPTRTPTPSPGSSPSALSPTPSPTPSRGAGGAFGAFACTLSSFAGMPGVAGGADGVALGAAQFTSPSGLALDAAAALYVADTGSHTIRSASLATGMVATIAGLAGSPGVVDGPGATARLNGPTSLALWGGQLLIADTGSHTVRALTIATLSVARLAGTGAAGSVDSALGTSAQFSSPRGAVVVANATAASPALAVLSQHCVRLISLSMAGNPVSTLAGACGTAGYADAAGTAARFSSPRGLASSPLRPSALYIADSANAIVRVVSLAPGVWQGYAAVSTLVGTPYFPGYQDALAGGVGLASLAQFNGPSSVAISPWNGTLLVCDRLSHLVRSVDIFSGRVGTFAGILGAGLYNSTTGQSTPPTAAGLQLPDGIAADNWGLAPGGTLAAGRIFLSDTGNHQILALACAASQSPSPSPSPTPTSGVSPSPSPTSSATPSAPPPPSASLTPSPTRSPSGTPTPPQFCTTTTLAGTGAAGLAVAMGGGTGSFNTPQGLASTTADGSTSGSAGSLYISDRLNMRLRRLALPSGGDVNGYFSYVGAWAPTGGAALMAADGVGTAASLWSPSGLAMTPCGPGCNGTLWVAEGGSGRVRAVYPDMRIVTLAGSGSSSSSSASRDGVGSAASLSGPEGVCTVPPLVYPPSGTLPHPTALLVAEAGGHAIRWVGSLAAGGGGATFPPLRGVAPRGGWTAACQGRWRASRAPGAWLSMRGACLPTWLTRKTTA